MSGGRYVERGIRRAREKLYINGVRGWRGGRPWPIFDQRRKSRGESRGKKREGEREGKREKEREIIVVQKVGRE